MKPNGRRSENTTHALQAQSISASPGAVAHDQGRTALAVLRRIPWAIIVVAVVVLSGLVVYFHKEIAEFLGQLMGGCMLLAVLWAIKEFLEFIFAWPIRKLGEGFKQIKYALDWTPGWVYLVLLVALAVSDWFGVLPYGVRDLGTWMSGSSTNNAAPLPAKPGGVVPGNSAPWPAPLPAGPPPRFTPHYTELEIS